MRVREHRGSFVDALATEFAASTKLQLVEEMKVRLQRDVKIEDVEVKFYVRDNRANWGDTYIITWKHQVFGFSNGMLD
jgi:hypothetical protein